VISPLLSNLYLTEVDRMLERAKEATHYGKYTYIEYARFADDLVILIDAYPSPRRLQLHWPTANPGRAQRASLSPVMGSGRAWCASR
jgi:hypothetical protein